LNRRDAALAFIGHFCQGRVRDLTALLTEDFRFEGPFFSAGTRDEYVAALEADPPEAARFDLLRVFEAGDDVCLLYRYHKGGESALMAQWTRFLGKEISGITLIFDPRGLA